MCRARAPEGSRRKYVSSDERSHLLSSIRVLIASAYIAAHGQLTCSDYGNDAFVRTLASRSLHGRL